ncbi:efflux RND transporter permease subunit [Pedobacter endophyticus]|nr:efflux RND transporter permease subunit [Pedobacter endophyticus]
MQNHTNSDAMHRSGAVRIPTSILPVFKQGSFLMYIQQNADFSKGGMVNG